MRWFDIKRFERWECHQEREAMGRLYVDRESTGRGSITIELALPWPDVTHQWARLFGSMKPVRGVEWLSMEQV